MALSSLKIYNSRVGRKEEFRSLSPGQVKMYCCGPTVYDLLHIGNFRGAVFYNFVRNWLEFSGYEVSYVYNFTDVDDKILNRAKKEKEKPQDLADKYIKEFEKDYSALKLKAHTHNPRATEHIPEMIALIERLMDRGKAYKSGGDVFFSVRSFPEYGALSKRKTEELISGIRVQQNEKKRDPLDFALWKRAKTGEDWFWNSPWGTGRPGWHLECTAMIHKRLGEEIDIHGGGTDLIFPHHENEIAQSEGCSGKTYVRYWVHNNMIDTDGNKMSKSLGNIITMREFLKQHPGEVFKYVILSSHYRSPVTVSPKTLDQAVSGLARIYSSLLKAQSLAENGHKKINNDFQSLLSRAEKETTSAFNDDFATPKGFAVFFSLVKSFNSILSEIKISVEEKAWCAEGFLSFFKKYGATLSLFQEDPAEFLKIMDDRILKRKNLSRDRVDEMVRERASARKNKNFDRADQLRKELTALGIRLQDSPRGTTWELDRSSE